MTRRTITLLALGSLSLSACGGAKESATAPATPEALHSSSYQSAATAYVVHGINGKDLGLDEALPVDLQVGDTCALKEFKFRDIAGPLSLPAGTYNIQVKLAATPACSGAVAISAPGLKLDAGANVSIVAHLADAAKATPTATVFANDVTVEWGRSRAIARHAADFGGVDVLVDGKVALANLTNGEQGTATLKPRKHTVSIAPTGSSTAVFEKPFFLKPFTVYVAYAVGTPANGTFEVLLQTLPMSRLPEREKPAIVYVVHGINGKDLGQPTDELPVDVELNGNCALTNFKFRDITGPVKLQAGTYDINVRLAAQPACSGTVAIAAPGVKLDPGADVTIVAHLANATPSTPTASIFANDTSQTHGKARVVARHAANFGAVDVLVDGAVAFPSLLNGQQAMADLKPGPYDIAIAPADSTVKVFDQTLQLEPARAYSAYAVGTPANGTFEVLLQVIPIARRCDIDDAHDSED